MSLNDEFVQLSQANLKAVIVTAIQKHRYQSTIIFCMVLFCHSFPVFPDNQENLKLLRERIRVLQQDLKTKESAKQDASEALRKTSQAISAITSKLAQLKEEDQKAIIEYRQFQHQYQSIQKEIALERDALEKLLYQQYIEGHQNYLRLALNQQNPNQIARVAYYYRQLSLARINGIENLQSNQHKIDELLQISRQKKEEITAIQSEYFDQRKKLEAEKIKYQNLLAQVSHQITKQQQEVDGLIKNEKHLANLIDEINKVITKKESAVTQNASINNKVPEIAAINTSFPTLKGKLNLPVRGKLVNTFGGQRSGRQLTWKGLFIQSPEGNEVKAISGGSVVFADWLRGFGNLIIIDHGSSYMSLYGNNATLHKQVGDTIHGGETIATVGNSSGNLDSGLYFELRHQGKPFDPLTWIKIE